MGETDNPIIQFFLEYAYEPLYVYSAITVLLVASSFGLPFPEEVTLLSAGLLAHIGEHPDLYPPPTPDAVGVSVGVTAAVCFFAVLLSDLLVFWLGKTFGARLMRHSLVQRLIKPEIQERINKWTRRFGPYACGVFRFTPGLRFPGHFACGSFGISYSTFILVDGTAALLTVPTQVVLMAFFGEEILSVLKNIKLTLAIVLVVIVVVFAFRSWRSRVKATVSVEALPASVEEI